MQILLCESCKFGEKICYNNWDNEFFLRDCFLLVHPVYPSQTKNYVFVCNAWLLLWLAASTQQSLYTLQWTCKCPPHKCRFFGDFLFVTLCNFTCRSWCCLYCNPIAGYVRWGGETLECLVSQIWKLLFWTQWLQRVLCWLTCMLQILFVHHVSVYMRFCISCHLLFRG